MCAKFESTGLLYVSGELAESEVRAYEAHIAECEECRRETETYKSERASFYTADILGEAPPEAVDAEIIRVCANPKGARPTVFMPMMFLKKYAAAPIFLMLIMVAIGGYIRYHTMNAEGLREQLTKESGQTETIAVSPNDSAAPGQNLAAADSSNDGEKSRPMGNMNMEGVVPVSGE